MMNREFYVILPSNVISEEFSNNKTSHFSTALPSHLELGTNKWEVALAEITYPHTWFNLENPFLDIIRHIDAINEEKYRVRIPSGYYDGGTEIVEALNQLLKVNQINGLFKYNLHNNRVSFKLYNGYHIKLSNTLAAVLGFYEREFDRSSGILLPETEETRSDFPNSPLKWENMHSVNYAKYITQNSVDLNIKTHNIFIYTNIVNYMLVGNIYVPLLRILPTQQENRGKYITKHFLNRYYIPLNSNYIKQILIDMRDDQGNAIRFRSGKVTVTLHFRQVPNINHDEI